MTREEAVKIVGCYDIGFYDLSGEKIPADKLADAFDMAIEALSAEKTGTWIRHERGLFFGYKCSQCGELSEIPTDYCPHCGAKMKGGDSDD